MTSAPEGFEEPLRGPGGWREQLRRSAVARMPEDSRRRAVAVAGRDTLVDLRETMRSVRRHWAAAGVAELPAPPYPVWRLSHGPSTADLAAHRARASLLSDGLDVRILVLPGAGDLTATLTSLQEQSSPHWRALVPGAVWADDPRIATWAEPAELSTWLAAAGRAMTLVLRAGDRLARDCVYHVALTVHRSPLLELVTWDDDVISGLQHQAPRLRPSWSPELLLAEDYVGGAFAMRAATILQAGGLPDPSAALSRVGPAAASRPPRRTCR